MADRTIMAARLSAHLRVVVSWDHLQTPLQSPDPDSSGLRRTLCAPHPRAWQKAWCLISLR